MGDGTVFVRVSNNKNMNEKPPPKRGTNNRLRSLLLHSPASSRTRNLTLDRSAFFISSKSLSLPGVAMTTSIPRSKAAI